MKKKTQLRNLVHGVIALACLTLVSLPVSSQSERGGQSGPTSSSCASLLAPSLSTYAVSPGMNVGVFSRLTNCTSRKKAYTVVVSSVSSCGEETVVASNRISFKGGETKLLSVSYPIAPGTCLGQMAVTVSAYDGAMLDSQSTSLMVQN